MSEKFNQLILEEPYSFKYKSAFVYARKDQGGRRHVALLPISKKENKKVTISYARYLYQIHLWKKGFGWIPKDKEVDHINNDFLDDRIENYQLLIHEFNMKKMNAFRGYGAYVVVCFYCGKQHIVKKWSVDDHMNKLNSPAMCCSRSCASSSLGDTILVGQTREWVKTHQLQYEIRSHYFEYEDWYGPYYPYTEIISFKSRELIDYKGIDYLRSRLPQSLKFIANDELKAPIDIALLIRDYINNEKSVPQIAEFLGMHDATIYQYINRYNIFVPYRKEQEDRIAEIELLLKQGMQPKEVSERLNIHYNIALHHSRRLNLVTAFNARKKLLWDNVPKMYFEEKLPTKVIAKKLGFDTRTITDFVGRIKKRNNSSLNSALIQDVSVPTPLESLLRS